MQRFTLALVFFLGACGYPADDVLCPSGEDCTIAGEMAPYCQQTDARNLTLTPCWKADAEHLHGVCASSDTPIAEPCEADISRGHVVSDGDYQGLIVCVVVVPSC